MFRSIALGFFKVVNVLSVDLMEEAPEVTATNPLAERLKQGAGNTSETSNPAVESSVIWCQRQRLDSHNLTPCYLSAEGPS